MTDNPLGNKTHVQKWAHAHTNTQTNRENKLDGQRRSETDGEDRAAVGAGGATERRSAERNRKKTGMDRIERRGSVILRFLLVDPSNWLVSRGRIADKKSGQRTLIRFTCWTTQAFHIGSDRVRTS